MTDDLGWRFKILSPKYHPTNTLGQDPALSFFLTKRKTLNHLSLNFDEKSRTFSILILTLNSVLMRTHHHEIPSLSSSTAQLDDHYSVTVPHCHRRNWLSGQKQFPTCFLSAHTISTRYYITEGMSNELLQINTAHAA